MDEAQNREDVARSSIANEVKTAIRETLEEFARREEQKAEPAYKNELAEERRKRELLERRVNELIAENARNKQAAEEAERNAAIRAELQRLGVVKVDLAFKAVKDDIHKSEDGQLVAANEQGTVALREYLTQFVKENPELLPPRNLSGSGATPNPRNSLLNSSGIELEKIKPGMAAEDLNRVRQEVARIAAQALGGRA